MSQMIDRTVPRTPRCSWTSRLAASLLLMAAALPACNKAPAEPEVVIGQVPRPDGRAAGKACGLEVTNTEIDLGHLEWNVEAKGEFSFRNQTSSPLQISLGAATCSCLRVVLEPKDASLQPGQQGHLTVYLNTKDRTGAGKVEGSISIGTNLAEGAVQFSVSGHLEGVSPPEQYVIRPRHVRSNKVPDIEFGIFTRLVQTSVKIRSVTCHVHRPDLAPARAVQPGLPQPQPIVVDWPLLSDVTVLMKRMTIGEPNYLPTEHCYVRTVRVPVQCLPDPKAASGRVVVKYFLGGEEKVTHFPFLVLSSE